MAQSFSYEIMEEMAVLSKNNKGWQKELNLVSWNGNQPKFDIRDWAPNHEKMGKGLTLSNEEMETLKKFLLTLD
ncbi:YdbC family protein [Carnobacterium sp.]|uniref:YdbC family protein n=1 Tax=Carnobacterium sp. TaxID=48221 RepID=UPI003C709FB4